MLVFRWILMVLLLGAGVSFAFYAASGDAKYKRYGLVILKWTLLAAAAFFLVLFLERVFA